MRLPVSRSAALLTLTVAGVAASLVPSTSALAAPNGCSAQYTGYSSGAMVCNQGSGTYRVRISCDKPLAPDYNVYGPYVSIGNTSNASCNSGNRAYGIFMDI